MKNRKLAADLRTRALALLEEYLSSLPQEERKNLEDNLPRNLNLQKQVEEKVTDHMRELVEEDVEERSKLETKPEIIAAELVRETFADVETRNFGGEDKDVLRERHKNGFDEWLNKEKGIDIYRDLT